MVINKKEWEVCKICQEKVSNLAKEYGGHRVYYSQVFKKHLEIDHKITLEEYFDITDTCECSKKCGKQKKVTFHKKSNFKVKKISCGFNKGIEKWSKEAKTKRKGSGNPMYGAKPWNKGLTASESDSIKIAAEKRIGRKVSEKTKKRQSTSAKKRKIHGHTGCRHSEKTKEIIRQKTLASIKSGKFKQTKTKPHICLAAILEELNINYEEEKILNKWSFDFYLTDFDIFLEADGDYFHSNPKFYPDGPISKTQKRNKYRDDIKNNFCKEKDIILIRFWEHDILNNRNKIKREINAVVKNKKN